MEAIIVYVTLSLFVVSVYTAHQNQNVFQFEIQEEAVETANEPDWRKWESFPPRVEEPRRKDKLVQAIKSVLNHNRFEIGNEAFGIPKPVGEKSKLVATRADGQGMKSALNHYWKVKLTGYKDCGNGSDIVQFSGVSLPDTIEPGKDINIAAKITIKEDINSPIKALTILKRKAQSSWINLPCLPIGGLNFGTCNYDDLCELMKKIPKGACPHFLKKEGLNCTCPIKSGTYSFNQQVGPIPSEAAAIAGKYFYTATLTTDSKTITCLEVNATIS